jgi:hypothetical protein
MPRFNASFNLSQYTPLDPPGTFQVQGSLVDNTGLFYYGDLSVGDILFSNGLVASYPLVLKYKIASIDNVDTNVEPVVITATVTQDYPSSVDQVFEPQVIENIVGRPNESGVIQLPDAVTFNLSTDFINGVRNYQTDLLNSSLLTLGSGAIAPISGGSSNRMYSVGFSGSLDGFNTSYVMDYAFVSNSVSMYFNGQKLIRDRD